VHIEDNLVHFFLECTLQRNTRPQPISYKMSKRYCFSF